MFASVGWILLMLFSCKGKPAEVHDGTLDTIPYYGNFFRDRGINWNSKYLQNGDSRYLYVRCDNIDYSQFELLSEKIGTGAIIGYNGNFDRKFPEIGNQRYFPSSKSVKLFEAKNLGDAQARGNVTAYFESISKGNPNKGTVYIHFL